jgi:hypothetical protein
MAKQDVKLNEETVYNFLVVWFCAAEAPLLEALVAEQYEPWTNLGLAEEQVSRRRGKIMPRLDLFRAVSSQACCSPPCRGAEPGCYNFLAEVVDCAKDYLDR